MVYLGIDPGASGGLAVLDGKSARAVKMPPNEADVWVWVLEHRPDRGFGFAVIEQVSGFMKRAGFKKGEHVLESGATFQPGSHMFKFGQNYGMLRGFLVAAGFVEGETFRAVPPAVWQKALGMPSRRESASQQAHKAALKERAQVLFPGLRVTLNTADALLLAHYCRLKTEGRL
jgi:hypothetical protein